MATAGGYSAVTSGEAPSHVLFNNVVDFFQHNEQYNKEE